MAERALVLGGGGTVGIAWETGLLAGLQRAGVSVADADLIVGTSAGSVVGAQLALGLPLEVLVAAQLAPVAAGEPQPAFDQGAFGAVVQLLGRASEASPDLLAEVGRIALAVPTADEDQYLARFALLADAPWPQRDLRITAVDALSGAFRAWGRADGVPLGRAVAASCAVPGIFPPVTIGGRRYMDGGMRSDTNADLASGSARVLVVAPIGSEAAGAGFAARRPVLREAEQLRASGAQVELVEPGPAARLAFGANLMDPARRAGAAEAGLQQGLALAERVGRLWL
jgi:NTE family protein